MSLKPNMTKDEVREWMGYDTAEAMDRDHDVLHDILCRGFDVEPQSLVGGEFWAQIYEEEAVLHVQRWLRKANYLEG